MTLQELLTSDMDLASLAALARQAWTWWLDELAAMAPRGWRDRLSTRPRVWIEPSADGGWRRWRDGRLDESQGTARSGKTRIGLLAPSSTVFTRRVPTPRMPLADVRRMVALDLDRLSPLSPDLVHADVEILDRGDGDSPQTVLLGLLPRDQAARLLSKARDDGFAPVALATRRDGGSGAPRFDFLPQALEAQGGARGDRTHRYLWAAAAALFAVNIGVLVGRDMIEVSRLQDAVDLQRPRLEAVQRLRRRVEREDADRRALIAGGRRSDPSRIIDILARGLPPTVWVQHLDWNGQRLRIVGFGATGADVAGALRATGQFSAAKPLAAVPGAANAAFRPFDVIADLGPEAKP